MSVEILRRAASLMRERAEAAICPCGGPRCNIADGGVRQSEMAARFDDWSRVVDHYVGMTPAVAVEFANWLDQWAEVLDRNTVAGSREPGCHPSHPSFAVARAYLGEPS